jgi:hypothetical protein
VRALEAPLGRRSRDRRCEALRRLTAREVSRAVFQISKSFPKEEMYSLTDQLRRAARTHH